MNYWGTERHQGEQHTSMLSIAATLRGRGLGWHRKCGTRDVRTACSISTLGEVAMTSVEYEWSLDPNEGLFW